MKIGTKLVCTKKNGWFGVSEDLKVRTQSYGPQHNEVVTYNGNRDSNRIYLKEYPTYRGYVCVWPRRFFKPVVETDVVIEIVEEVPDLIPVLV